MEYNSRWHGDNNVEYIYSRAAFIRGNVDRIPRINENSGNTGSTNNQEGNIW